MAALADLDQAFGFRSRHRIKNYGIDQTINRRAGPNAEREREHGHGGEAGVVAQHPRAVVQVHQQCLQHRNTTLVPVSFLSGLYPSEL